MHNHSLSFATCFVTPHANVSAIIHRKKPNSINILQCLGRTTSHISFCANNYPSLILLYVTQENCRLHQREMSYLRPSIELS